MKIQLVFDGSVGLGRFSWSLMVSCSVKIELVCDGLVGLNVELV